jgi:hypothetical protein
MNEPMRPGVPKGLRLHVEPDGLAAKVGRPRSVAILFLMAALWNLIMPLIFSPRDSALVHMVGLAAAVGFSLFALRAWLFKAQLSFRNGRFRCEVRPLSFKPIVDVPLSEVAEFAVIRASPEPSHCVVRMRSGVAHQLALPIDSMMLRINGGRPLTGVAPIESHSFLAEWLNTALELATHQGGTYRFAPGQEHKPGDSTEDTADVALRAER